MFKVRLGTFREVYIYQAENVVVIKGSEIHHYGLRGKLELLPEQLSTSTHKLSYNLHP